MGFFRKDPAQLLDRAEKLIGREEAVRAFELLAPHLESADPGVRARAAELAERAHRVVLDAALERAADAEAAGEPAEAADWLASALEHCHDPARRAELESRRASLLARGRERRESGPRGGAWAPPPMELDPESEAEPDELLEGEPSLAEYDLFLDTLTAEAAERYADRPRLFQEACLAILEGRPALARAALDELLAEEPEEPIYRLERGRCRLLLGDAAGAREDLETVWSALGDAPLDRAGACSVPALWADALLELRQPEPILERLKDLAEPRAGDGRLTLLYGYALHQAGRAEAARDHLAEARGFLPGDRDLAFALARVEAGLGETRSALRILEQLAAPAFDGSDHPPDVAVLRLLASLHLDEGGPLDVVGGLLKRSTEGRTGRLEHEDYRLLARYHEALGDAEAARRAAAAAARLEPRKG